MIAKNVFPYVLQLVVTPPVISTGTFITVLRMLSVMCANCPELALCLLKQNIADTLCYLLTGMTSDSIGDEVISYFYFIYLYI